MPHSICGSDFSEFAAWEAHHPEYALTENEKERSRVDMGQTERLRIWGDRDSSNDARSSEEEEILEVVTETLGLNSRTVNGGGVGKGSLGWTAQTESQNLGPDFDAPPSSQPRPFIDSDSKSSYMDIDSKGSEKANVGNIEDDEEELFEEFDVTPEDSQFFKELLPFVPDEELDALQQAKYDDHIATSLESHTAMSGQIEQLKTSVQAFAQTHPFWTQEPTGIEELREYQHDVYEFGTAAGLGPHQSRVEVMRAVGAWKVSKGLSVANSELEEDEMQLEQALDVIRRAKSSIKKLNRKSTDPLKKTSPPTIDISYESSDPPTEARKRKKAEKQARRKAAREARKQNKSKGERIVEPDKALQSSQLKQMSIEPHNSLTRVEENSYEETEPMGQEMQEQVEEVEVSKVSHRRSTKGKSKPGPKTSPHFSKPPAVLTGKPEDGNFTTLKSITEEASQVVEVIQPPFIVAKVALGFDHAEEVALMTKKKRKRSGKRNKNRLSTNQIGEDGIDSVPVPSESSRNIPVENQYNGEEREMQDGTMYMEESQQKRKKSNESREEKKRRKRSYSEASLNIANNNNIQLRPSNGDSNESETSIKAIGQPRADGEDTRHKKRRRERRPKSEGTKGLGNTLPIDPSGYNGSTTGLRHEDISILDPDLIKVTQNAIDIEILPAKRRRRKLEAISEDGNKGMAVDVGYTETVVSRSADPVSEPLGDTLYRGNPVDLSKPNRRDRGRNRKHQHNSGSNVGEFMMEIATADLAQDNQSNASKEKQSRGKYRDDEWAKSGNSFAAQPLSELNSNHSESPRTKPRERASKQFTSPNELEIQVDISSQQLKVIHSNIITDPYETETDSLPQWDSLHGDHTSGKLLSGNRIAFRTPSPGIEVIIYTPSKASVPVDKTEVPQLSQPVSEIAGTTEADDNTSVFSMSHYGSLDWDHSGDEFDKIQVTPKITRRGASISPENRPNSSIAIVNHPQVLEKDARRVSVDSSHKRSVSVSRDSKGRFAAKQNTPGCTQEISCTNGKKLGRSLSPSSDSLSLSSQFDSEGKCGGIEGLPKQTSKGRKRSLSTSSGKGLRSVTRDSRGRFLPKETRILLPNPINFGFQIASDLSPLKQPPSKRGVKGLPASETQGRQPSSTLAVLETLTTTDQEEGFVCKPKKKAKRSPAKSPYFTLALSPEKGSTAAEGPGASGSASKSTPKKRLAKTLGIPNTGDENDKSLSPDSAKKRRLTKNVSCIPFPPLCASQFGLIQEKLADDPFRLLIAVTFLIKTTGKSAIPVFYELMDKYPTPESLAAAEKEDIVKIIHCLGLQNQRAATYKTYAKIWLENPPTKDKRYAVRWYPNPDSGRDIKKGEILTDEDERDAWEIGHMTQGPYAIDSWRIFCRDKFRGVADGYAGEGRGLNFQPEWMRVLPADKELRAFLRWMWLKEGFDWDPLTGEKEVASRDLMRAALKGRLVWDDLGGMSILDESEIVDD